MTRDSERTNPLSRCGADGLDHSSAIAMNCRVMDAAPGGWLRRPTVENYHIQR
jgi:hypothetical protein